MAIAFRAAATGTRGGAASPCTVNVPAGVVNGDVMVAVVMAGGANTLTPPAGWTQLDVAFSLGPSIGSWYRVASSEPASYNWTYSGSLNVTGIISAYSGVDTTTPVPQHSAWHRRTSSTLITGDSITTTVNGTWILHLGGDSSATTITQPSGWNQRANPNAGGTTTALSDIPFASLGAPTSGPTGDFNATGASGNTQGSLIALKPAGAAAVTAHARALGAPLRQTLTPIGA